MNDGLSVFDMLVVIFLSALLGALGGTTLTVILFFLLQEQIATMLLESLLF